MLRYILRRLLLLIPLLLAASAIIFLLLRLGAGDPALDYLRLSNLPPTEEMVASTRELLGLNQPLAMKYNGKVYYYVLNAQGDVVRIVDGSR